MDGNGRWAKKRLLPRAAGHRAGLTRMIGLSDHIFACGVEYCTLFALSAENLARPKEELDALFALFCEYFSEYAEPLKEKGIRLKTLGDPALVPENVRKLMREAEEKTRLGERGTLSLAIGYGGRQDIVRACGLLAQKGEPVTAENFAAALSTGGMPAVDLLIRTGKEKRLSNFLLYEAAYAELYFSDLYFPDFSDEAFDSALAEFARRDRRFGKL